MCSSSEAVRAAPPCPICPSVPGTAAGQRPTCSICMTEIEGECFHFDPCLHAMDRLCARDYLRHAWLDTFADADSDRPMPDSLYDSRGMKALNKPLTCPYCKSGSALHTALEALQRDRRMLVLFMELAENHPETKYQLVVSETLPVLRDIYSEIFLARDLPHSQTRPPRSGDCSPPPPTTPRELYKTLEVSCVCPNTMVKVKLSMLRPRQEIVYFNYFYAVNMPSVESDAQEEEEMEKRVQGYLYPRRYDVPPSVLSRLLQEDGVEEVAVIENNRVTGTFSNSVALSPSVPSRSSSPEFHPTTYSPVPSESPSSPSPTLPASPPPSTSRDPQPGPSSARRALPLSHRRNAYRTPSEWKSREKKTVEKLIWNMNMIRKKLDVFDKNFKDWKTIVQCQNTASTNAPFESLQSDLYDISRIHSSILQKLYCYSINNIQ